MPLDIGFANVDILNNAQTFYYFVLAVFAVCAAAMAFLLRSPFGRTLLAIRENERRARFLGIPVDRHIWLSWVVSCCFVSVAGTLFALMNNFVDPRALRWDQSGDFVIMAVLGGMRSFWGPLIGSAIFLVLQDYISSHTENWDVVHRPLLCLDRAVLPARGPRHRPTARRAMSLLRVENVSRRFGSLVAVDRVSMTVEAGELRAVIGPNGAGKTTFFNMISGFLAPSAGHIVFDGEDITRQSAKLRASAQSIVLFSATSRKRTVAPMSRWLATRPNAPIPMSYRPRRHEARRSLLCSPEAERRGSACPGSSEATSLFQSRTTEACPLSKAMASARPAKAIAPTSLSSMA
jgi:ABC-type multidrug transport system fused ATPase/permease subunit